jgi:hypothetical protein
MSDNHAGAPGAKKAAPAPAGPDLSTINATKLAKLPPLALPPTHKLQRGLGTFCAGDPPGFPSYFLRHIYNARGDTPESPQSAVLELLGHVFAFGSDESLSSEAIQSKLRRLWVPLPFDHPRVQAWVASTFAHFRSCYVDAERPEYGRPGTLIYPLPDYALRHTPQDPRWSEEAKRAQAEADAAVNRAEEERARRIAIPENHRAVVAIREFYPDFTPGTVEVQAEGGKVRLPITDPRVPWDWRAYGGLWWETEAERPTPATCKPRSTPSRHPDEGWCQWCGYTDGKDETANLPRIVVPLKGA